jgi:hypothetical protein
MLHIYFEAVKSTEPGLTVSTVVPFEEGNHIVTLGLILRGLVG